MGKDAQDMVLIPACCYKLGSEAWELCFHLFGSNADSCAALGAGGGLRESPPPKKKTLTEGCNQESIVESRSECADVSHGKFFLSL